VKEDWWKYALLALAAISFWFVKLEVSDFKDQNKAQWQEAARTKQCVFDELAKIKERVSHIEGYHQAECKEKPK
jgi:hypothetical protein